MLLSKLSNIISEEERISKEDLLNMAVIMLAFELKDTKSVAQATKDLVSMLKRKNILEQRYDLLSEYYLAASKMSEVNPNFSKFLLESVTAPDPIDNIVREAINEYSILWRIYKYAETYDGDLRKDEELWYILSNIIMRIIRSRNPEASHTKLLDITDQVINNTRYSIIETISTIVNIISEYVQRLDSASITVVLRSYNLILEAKQRVTVKQLLTDLFDNDEEATDEFLRYHPEINPDVDAAASALANLAKHPEKMRKVSYKLSKDFGRLHFKRDVYSRQKMDDLLGIGPYIGQGGMFLHGLMNIIMASLVVGSVIKYTFSPTPTPSSLSDSNIVYAKRVIVAAYQMLKAIDSGIEVVSGSETETVGPEGETQQIIVSEPEKGETQQITVLPTIEIEPEKKPGPVPKSLPFAKEVTGLILAGASVEEIESKINEKYKTKLSPEDLKRIKEIKSRYESDKEKETLKTLRPKVEFPELE